jgi:ComF family protein
MQCRVCGALLDSLDDGVACQRCWQAAEAARLNYDVCEKCDASLPRLQLRPQLRRCGLCDEQAFAFARACGTYHGAFRESVLRLKVQPELPVHLRRLLHETFWLLPKAQEIEAIVPVPLHPTRQQERQFNQAEIVARALARTTALPVLVSALIRTKATELHRGGMDAQARQQSLHGAFAVRAPRLLERHTILLVDDVMTTGATAHEIAQTLQANGTHNVSVLTLARANSAAP